MVMSILSILFLFSMPILFSFVTKNNLVLGTNTVVRILNQAKEFSISQKKDIPWGVHLEGNTLTLFGGNTFSTRDVSLDENTILSKDVNLNGPQDIVFQKLYGIPSQTGTITMRDTAGETRMITINAEGLVDY